MTTIDISENQIALWAHCPYCGPQVHGAMFAVQLKLVSEINWDDGEVAVRFDADTRPLKDHLRKLHPDKLLSDAGVCT